MIETKVIQIANNPETINRVNGIWSSFGWTVMNVQVTNTQNTKTYTKDFLDYYSGINTVETTTINYATITYQRDTKMEKYDEICRTEEEFVACMNELNRTECSEDIIGPLVIKVGTFFCIILGIGRMLYFTSETMLSGLALMMLGPVLIREIYKMTKGKKLAEEQNRVEEKRNDLRNKLDQILDKARQI